MMRRKKKYLLECRDENNEKEKNLFDHIRYVLFDFNKFLFLSDKR